MVSKPVRMYMDNTLLDMVIIVTMVTLLVTILTLLVTMVMQAVTMATHTRITTIPIAAVTQAVTTLILTIIRPLVATILIQWIRFVIFYFFIISVVYCFA